MDTLFPASLADRSIEQLLADNTRGSMFIYKLILFGLLGAFLSTFFIRVDIVSTSRGIIRSPSENLPILALSSGIVCETSINENAFVRQGDTLIVLDCGAVEQRIRQAAFAAHEARSFISDLGLILAGREPRFTQLYREEWTAHQSGAGKYRRDTEYAEGELEMATRLFREEVIPRAEYEKAVYSYQLSFNAEEQFLKAEKSRWQKEKVQQSRLLQQIIGDSVSAATELTYRFLLAPTDGTLINCSGLKAGNQIYSGQQLAELSTLEQLIVECYLSPTDIGRIHTGLRVKMHIDAYNYREWGVLEGSISEIGEDISLINGLAVYRVRVQPDTFALSLNDNISGQLKKGMSLSAHFILSRRTLIQLIFDKADKWINPVQHIPGS